MEGEGEEWRASLLSQLATRNVLQGAYFRDVLAVHGETTTDERDYRRRARISEPLAAEAEPLREKHNAVLLENAGLQQRLQEVEQEAEALRTENATLKASILVRPPSLPHPSRPHGWGSLAPHVGRTGYM